MTDTPRNLDEARLRPHLRPSAPRLIVQPDAGINHIPTFNGPGTPKARTPSAAVGEPGDLRGIPVVGARGVSGVSPGTQPERATINKLSRERAA